MFFLNGLESTYLSHALLIVFRVVKNLVLGIWIMGFHFFLVGMVWMVCLIPLTLVGVGLETRGRLTAWYTHNLMGRPIMYLAGIGVEYKNAIVLKKSGPFIVAANHASWIDIVVLLFVPNFLFVSKQLVGYFPPLGPIGRGSGQCFVPRGGKGSLQMIWSALRKRPNANLLVYIEGTRTKDGKLGELKSGAAYTSLEFNRAIIPTTIVGTYGILGDSLLHFLANFRGGRVSVVFHEPIFPLEGESAEDLTKRVGKVIHSVM
jgi:1-acyl-sn-glycerol-3-phosphate acyltransferase